MLLFYCNRMITYKIIHKYLYTSSNEIVFQINFLFWSFMHMYLANYYGICMFSMACGLLFWSFWEYLYHRFVMHGLRNTKYYYKLHGYHHQYPDKLSHIPAFQYIIVSLCIYGSTWVINPSIVYSYAIGHLLGLYCFENMHCMIHRDNEKTMIYTKYHWHHHNYSNSAFCFTTPCFDILCGTFPETHFYYNALALLPIPCIAFYGVTPK